MAVLLVPEYHNFPTSQIGGKVRDFLHTHACNGAWQDAMREFNDYQTKTGNFSVQSTWRFASDPRIFWLEASSFAPTLAELAGRVLSITANSVMSERSFSLLNRIHTPSRSRLHVDKVDKMAFINANRPKVEEVHSRSPAPQCRLPGAEAFRQDFAELVAMYMGVEGGIGHEENGEVEEELVMEDFVEEELVEDFMEEELAEELEGELE